MAWKISSGRKTRKIHTYAALTALDPKHWGLLSFVLELQASLDFSDPEVIYLCPHVHRKVECLSGHYDKTPFNLVFKSLKFFFLSQLHRTRPAQRAEPEPTGAGHAKSIRDWVQNYLLKTI